MNNYGRTRVKICGITNLEDALLATDLGADALGFVFYPASPRAVEAEHVAAIAQQLPVFVTKVGLFVDAAAEQVAQTAKQARLDCLQFHGQESQEFCQQFGMPWFKAVRVQSAQDVEQALAAYPLAHSLLFDAFVPGVPGGTGQSFDWQCLTAAQASHQRLILAGGLNADNVASAIAQVRPYAVDVSGGVEQAKGKKSAEHLRAFMANCQ